jgi:RNA polymerase sigma-70 factor (ECF subfamily)
MINFFHEDNRLEIDESMKYIRKIIKTLPSVQQEVVVLKDFEGFTNEEISEITSLGENNIRVILSRCRKHIKEQLINKYDIKNPL